jgi:LEA14-like dessication related protein
MKPRTWLILLVVLALLGVGGWYFWRFTKTPTESAQGLKPELSVATVNITDISPERIKLTVKAFLKNPTPIEVKTSRLDYRILIDSTEVVKSSYTKPIVVRSSDSTAVELPMEILQKPLGRVIKRFTERRIDSANYSMLATLHADVPIAGEREFHFDKTTRLPAFQIPEVKVDKVNVDKLGLKESKIGANLLIHNPNTFPFKFKDARFTLKVGDEMTTNGGVPGLTSIPAKGSGPLPVYLNVDTDDAGKLIWQTLFKKKETALRLDFRCKLVSDLESLKNSEMALKVNTTLAELTGKK